MSFPSFLRNNGGKIAFVAWLALFHWGWQKMQYLPEVQRGDKPERLPVFEILQNNANSEKKKAEQ